MKLSDSLLQTSFLHRPVCLLFNEGRAGRAATSRGHYARTNTHTHTYTVQVVCCWSDLQITASEKATFTTCQGESPCHTVLALSCASTLTNTQMHRTQFSLFPSLSGAHPHTHYILILMQVCRYDCTSETWLAKWLTVCPAWGPTGQPASCYGSNIKARWEEPVHLLLTAAAGPSHILYSDPSPPISTTSCVHLLSSLSSRISSFFPLSPPPLYSSPLFLLHLPLPTNHLLLRVNASVIIITGLCFILWENALWVLRLHSQRLSENMMSGMRTLGQKAA